MDRMNQEESQHSSDISLRETARSSTDAVDDAEREAKLVTLESRIMQKLRHNVFREIITRSIRANQISRLRYTQGIETELPSISENSFNFQITHK